MSEASKVDFVRKLNNVVARFERELTRQEILALVVGWSAGMASNVGLEEKLVHDAVAATYAAMKTQREAGTS